MINYTQFESKVLTNKLIDQALIYKNNPKADSLLAADLKIGLIFLNPSLRTRLSTQIAVSNLGAEAIVLNVGKESWALEFQEGAVMNGSTVEHVKDAVGVMSTYFDIIAIRTFAGLVDKKEDQDEKVLNQFIKHSKVPIVSLESATRHPLQSLADQITIHEHQLTKQPKIVLTWAPHIKPLPQAVANSFAEWTLGTHHKLTIAHPEGYELDEQFTKGATITNNQSEAIKNADFIYVKNWSSFKTYGKMLSHDTSWLLDENKLKEAPNAKIMHCLPVRRNVVLSDELLDGHRSLVMQQAENRIYAAQAVLKHLIEINKL